MSRSIALVFLALLAAVAVFWQVFSTPPPNTVIEVADQLDPAGDDRAQAKAEAQNDAVAEEASAARSEIDQGAVAAIASAVEVTPHYTAEDGVNLTLKDAISEEVLPGALLYVCDFSNLDHIATANLRLSQQDTSRRFGVRYQADEAGQVRIPPQPAAPRLFAETADALFYHYQYNLDSEDGILLLRKNRRLWVEVVNDADEPMADYPVSIYVGGGARMFKVAGATSDAEGRALFEDLDAMNSWNSMGSQFVSSGLVGFREPDQGTELIKLTPEVMKKGEVRIQGRETGRIEVTVFNRDGEKFAGRGWGSLS
jgi:hypothetical protein